MPTSDSSTHAAQARESLRHLAHSSRRIEDPGELYDLLGDISLALNSMAQSLHQIARVHDHLEPPAAPASPKALAADEQPHTQSHGKSTDPPRS